MKISILLFLGLILITSFSVILIINLCKSKRAKKKHNKEVFTATNAIENDLIKDDSTDLLSNNELDEWMNLFLSM